MRDEWGECSCVASGVEGDLVDAGVVGGAGEAAREVGAARDGTWVSGEVPGCYA